VGKRTKKKARPEQDEALLKEIRENLEYGKNASRENREERRKDMRYLAGDPWDPKERKAREDAQRPCINHDELNQYINQCVNTARQNKRGIKIEPAGNGATDKTAEFRQNLVRGIEYKSKAQAIYLQSFQAAVEGGYSYCRITRQYVPGSFNQDIVIKPIPNPDAVIYDPDCQEPDWSDAKWCFVLDPMSHAEFARRWPDAEIKTFGADEMSAAPQWINGDKVIVGEYWRIETKEDNLHELEDGTTVNDADLPEDAEPVRSRPDPQKTLVQYMTNGVEILERLEQPGDEIPIPSCVGMERWMEDEKGEVRRILSSLTRLARDPQMSLAYLNSQEMEEAGLSPKVPYIGYVGQFETDSEAWDTAHKIPHPRLQVDPVTDATGQQLLPLPQRQVFTPNFQAYEVAKDSCRRAIQAAMGISPLPTAAQRSNQKSGIALEKIQSEQAIGSYHFADGFDRFLARAGRIIDKWLAVTYDTQREVPQRMPDDTQRLVQANTPEPYLDPATQELQHYRTDVGDHDVTVSAGPSNESQREAASEFLDQLIGNLQALPVPPPQAAKLLALAIQMKQLGPKGDEMAEIIAPSDGQQLPPAAQAQVQKSQQQAQQLMAYVKLLQSELQKLQMEKQAKVVDNEYRMDIERMKIEAQVAAAEVNTKAQRLDERLAFVQDLIKQLHGQAHDVGMQAAQQEHEAQQQQDAQDAAMQQQQSAQAAQAQQAAQAAQQQPQVQQ
jgi:hypothetical protein